MAKGAKVIYGAAPINRSPVEEQHQVLDTLKKHHVKDIDTARIYPESEKTLGEIKAPGSFIIHTKAPGFRPGALAKESILAGAKQSLEDLGTNSVETYFLHAPDPETPIEETLEAIQELYKQKVFKKFGVSNFTPDEVQEVYDLSKSKGYVLPTVFQGNYNPVARNYDTTLFPLLRKLGISFYAYSPLAGGFLVKSVDFMKSEGEGRWAKGDMIGDLYHKLYNKPAMLDALQAWEDTAKEAGVSKAALAYRWTTYSSSLDGNHGDGIIVGATKLSQLEETLTAIEAGPLDKAIVAKIDKIWEAVKDDAPTDNFHG